MHPQQRGGPARVLLVVQDRVPRVGGELQRVFAQRHRRQPPRPLPMAGGELLHLVGDHLARAASSSSGGSTSWRLTFCSHSGQLPGTILATRTITSALFSPGGGSARRLHDLFERPAGVVGVEPGDYVAQVVARPRPLVGPADDREGDDEQRQHADQRDQPAPDPHGRAVAIFVLR